VVVYWVRRIGALELIGQNIMNKTMVYFERKKKCV
jgi:hypothetical protein